MCAGEARSGEFRSTLDACITTIVLEHTMKTPPRLSRTGSHEGHTAASNAAPHQS